MAAEADAVIADSLNGRRHAAAAAAAASVVVASLPSPPPPPPPLLLPPTPPLVATMRPAVTCTLVGEGSANAVFCVAPEEKHDSGGRSDPDSDLLSTHLLRIPKAGPGVGPTTCLDHHAYYSAVLRPLLGPEWLVGQHLVQGVVANGVHSALNRVLADLDRSGRRRLDWVGTRVADDVDVALLVEDMTLTCQNTPRPSTSTTVQFKPKWLVQSPSAPAGARRCRTCALSAASAAPAALGPPPHGAHAANGRVGRAPKAHKIKPCPMVLVADPPASPDEEADLEAALWDYVCKHLGSASSPSSPLPVSLLKLRPAIVRWLRTADLFRRVAAIQAEFDPQGALSVHPDDGTASLERLQTAMTLRDCTCYLRVTTGDGPSGAHAGGALPVSFASKLGDLDRKDGRRKLARWQAQERALLAGGFYLGTEEPRQQTQCWLGRRRG